MHLMTSAAKQVLAADFGPSGHHACFAGRSTGAQQSLTEAQRFPDDYSGILARARADLPFTDRPLCEYLNHAA